MVFENFPFQIPRIFSAINNWIEDRRTQQLNTGDCSIRMRPHDMEIPAIYFDGACAEGVMGCGAWIKLSQRERILIY